MIATAFLAVSCTNNAETTTEEETLEPVSYTVDVDASTLNWRGEENENHYHEGTIAFSEGSMTMKGNEVVEGNFKVDLSTIKVTDDVTPEEKIPYLISHLQDTAFFFMAEYPVIDVKVEDYTDGKLSTTISVQGVDITENVPVQITTTDDGASITGDFSIDLAPAKMMGFEPNPETGSAISSKVSFNLNLILTK